MTRKQLVRLDLETLLWCLMHPLVSIIRFAPKTRRWDSFIEKHFSNATIEKVFDCPNSYVTKSTRRKIWRGEL